MEELKSQEEEKSVEDDRWTLERPYKKYPASLPADSIPSNQSP